MATIFIFHYPSGTSSTLPFKSNREAFNSFAERCSDLDLEYEELDNGDLRAGGIGHDFLIDLLQNP